MKTIVLDPGHGGADIGTAHNGIVESIYTLVTANRVAELMARRGIFTIKTRDGDTDPTHFARAQAAVKADAAGTVLIHVNASLGADPREHGPLAYHLEHDAVGQQAAERFIKSMQRGGEYTRGAELRPMRWQVHVAHAGKWPGVWACLHQHIKPAVLLELEYCTHPASALFLLNESAWVARAIADAAETLCQ